VVDLMEHGELIERAKRPKPYLCRRILPEQARIPNVAAYHRLDEN
jgi:hypothetical protein